MEDKFKGLNKDRIKIVYDREADVLYVTKGTPEHTDSVEYTKDVILCFYPETQQLVGFTLIDFSEHFAHKDFRHRVALWCRLSCLRYTACLRMF